jgi:hypothetical protein
MNFGTIKDLFVEKLIESYINGGDEGKVIYKNFLKILKESETLKTAFIIFKNIEEKTFEDKIGATEYLKETISLFDGFRGEKSLNSEMKKLNNLIKESGLENKTPKTIHQDLQDLLTTPKTIHTLDKLQEAKERVINWLVSEKQVVKESEEEAFVRKNVNPKKFLEIAVEKFNDKYKDSLTEEEKNILKTLRENNENEIKLLVSELVKENISLVNSYIDENRDNVLIKAKLLETKDQIYRMVENNVSFKDSVLKLYELKKNLKDA